MSTLPSMKHTRPKQMERKPYPMHRKDDRNPSTANASAPPKTDSVPLFSRASIYAPLKSYDNASEAVTGVTSSSIGGSRNKSYSNDGGCPLSSSFKSLPTSVPKSLQDGALLAFWSSISTTMHRSTPRLDGKNTSGRPLSTVDMTNRMQQRVLTLVKDSKSRAKPHALVQPVISQSQQPTIFLPYGSTTGRLVKKKRTRMAQRLCHLSSQTQIAINASNDKNPLMEAVNLATTIGDGVDSPIGLTDVTAFDRPNSSVASSLPTNQRCHPVPTVRHHAYNDTQFLQELHAEWITYARSMLQIPKVCPNGNLNKDFTAQVAERARTVVDRMEWIGSKVRVMVRHGHGRRRRQIEDQNNDCHDVERFTGVLVAQTTNAWVVAPIVPERSGRSFEHVPLSVAKADLRSKKLGNHKPARWTNDSKESKTQQTSMVQYISKGDHFLKVLIPLDCEETGAVDIDTSVYLGNPSETLLPADSPLETHILSLSISDDRNSTSKCNKRQRIQR